MSTQPQTQAIEVRKTSPLITQLAERWKISAVTMIETLKATVFPTKDRNGNKVEVTNEQLIAFLQVADRYDLNPFVREIYAFPTKGGGIVPMVPVDGWSNIVNRNPQMDGIEFVDEWEVNERGARVGTIPFSTTAIIYRKDRSHPTKVTEYFAECNQVTKDTWKQWPARMLRHKSFIQCARIAFSLAGIYDPDEAERIAESENDKPKPIERPKVVEGTVTENLDRHTAPTVGQVATQTSACLCNCCKLNTCDCAGKAEFDRCGCQACASAVQTPKQEDKKAESAPSAAVPGDVPTGADLFGKPGDVAYCDQNSMKKVFAVAKSIWSAKEYEDKLHEFLRKEYEIDSFTHVPVAKREEIVERLMKKIGEKK